MITDHYVEDLIKRLGKERAEKSIIEAIKHHEIVFKNHKHEKSLTTIKFFQNAKQLLSK